MADAVIAEQKIIELGKSTLDFLVNMQIPRSGPIDTSSWTDDIKTSTIVGMETIELNKGSVLKVTALFVLMLIRNCDLSARWGRW